MENASVAQLRPESGRQTYYPPAIFSAGEIINDTYEVIRYLGIGASGVVYHCSHKDLNNFQLAMKVFFSPSIGSQHDLERFKRELLAAYRVSHPNVIRCYDLILSPGIIAFTMEYIGGGSLADRIGRTGPLPINQVIDILVAICSGLQAIHDSGIIHRDLKPANILITEEGNIKITDFGIARMEANGRISPRGVLGTVEYVSPEYCSQGQVDARSDIYSLGCIAYELLSARVPFRGEAPAQTICMKMDRDPLSVQRYREDCPDALASIVHKALERNPLQRFQSAELMLKDLVSLQERLQRDNKLQVSDEPVNEELTIEEKLRTLKDPRRRRSQKAKDYKYKRFGGRTLGVNDRFLKLFAVMTLVLWLGSVALWFYAGKSSVESHTLGMNFTSSFKSRF